MIDLKEMSHSVRDVFQEPPVSSALDNASHIYPRLDHQWLALEWTICRRPEAGVAVRFDFFVYRQKGVGSGNPDIVIVYKFDDRRVTIYEVRFVL